MANLMNIATNTQACLVEKMYGRNIMSSFHGLWSLGGFSGGIIGAIFANTLLPIDVHFGTILALSILIIVVGFRFLINDAMAKAEGRRFKVLFQDHRPDSVPFGTDGICRHVL